MMRIERHSKGLKICDQNLPSVASFHKKLKIFICVFFNLNSYFFPEILSNQIYQILLNLKKVKWPERLVQ